MSIQNVTLRQLRSFAAVLRSGTVTGAAEKAGITPPAVTSQLQLLREQLGVDLMERGRQGMQATEAGRDLLIAFERIEHILADCADRLDAHRNADLGIVSIGVISTAKYVIPRALAAFREAHPRIDMQLSVGNREQIIAGLRNYDLDVAVMGRPPESLDVVAEKFGPHPLVVVAMPSHPLVALRRIPPTRLQSEVFLAREPGSGTRMTMERFFAAHGLQPRIGMQIDSNETLKQAVIAGLGLAFISGHTLETDLKVGHLAVLDIEGLPILSDWFLVHMRDRPLRPVAHRLQQFIAANSHRFLPPPHG